MGHMSYQISELSIAAYPDQKLMDSLKNYDILSLHEILSKNSITTEFLWDLEEQQLREMGMNLGDRLKFSKAKKLRDEKICGKFNLF